jgi:hypothetical protein
MSVYFRNPDSNLIEVSNHLEANKGEGDSYSIPANVLHRIEIVEAGEVGQQRLQSISFMSIMSDLAYLT